MSNNEKMQALFDAALRADPKPEKNFERVVPEAKLETLEKKTKTKAIEPVETTIEPAKADVVQAVEFNKEEAEELGALLEEQMGRADRKRKMSLVWTLFFFGGTALGGVGWFVSDSNRFEALTSVVSDIRSVSDVKSIVAKFQDSLDRISVRGDQIEQATAAMGVTAKPGEFDDEYMEAEMKEMMGEESGRTVGEHNRMMEEAFSKRAEEAGGSPTNSAEASAKLKKFREESAFEWNK